MGYYRVAGVNQKGGLKLHVFHRICMDRPFGHDILISFILAAATCLGRSRILEINSGFQQEQRNKNLQIHQKGSVGFW